MMGMAREEDTPLEGLGGAGRQQPVEKGRLGVGRREVGTGCAGGAAECSGRLAVGARGDEKHGSPLNGRPEHLEEGAGWRLGGSIARGRCLKGEQDAGARPLG